MTDRGVMLLQILSTLRSDEFFTDEEHRALIKAILEEAGVISKGGGP